jgi:hypothetical protein
MTALCHSEAIRTDRARMNRTMTAMTANAIPIGSLRLAMTGV